MAFSAIVTFGFGVAVLGMGISMLPGGETPGGLDPSLLTGMAIFLGMIAFVRRIAESRVILGRQRVTVVNPLFTYDIPCRHVAKVAADQNGNPVITTLQAVEIQPLGFAGSILDHFVGSSDKAVAVIKAIMAGHRTGDDALPVRRPTRAWVTDGCVLMALVCCLLIPIASA
ncbi:hypothetical protein ACIQU4_41590 [Streptomyces sp. NPDC090741]|uniref:hypothetical protein n=1 Tax=Streptomyces sp. NPDC090741 TaxID=3365967 RepID=UPI0038202D1D